MLTTNIANKEEVGRENTKTIRRNKDRSANKKWHNAHNSHLLYWILGRIIIIKQVLKREAKQILNLLEDTISTEFLLESRIKVTTRRKVLLPSFNDKEETLILQLPTFFQPLFQKITLGISS